MARVIEVEATREQVSAFIEDCKRIEATFRDSMQTAETRQAIAEVKTRWEPLANGPGPRLSGAGLYGDLLQAINQLPKLNRPSEWFSALYDALNTAKHAASIRANRES